MSRAASQIAELAASIDDIVLPFQIKALGVRGRLARLGPMVSDVISRHDYPDAVSRLLAEAVALTAMLGTTLKFEGRLIVQTKTDGPVDMLVVDFTAPGAVRGYAHFDAEKVAGLDPDQPVDQPALLGNGHLAMTIDQGGDMERYQGIVPLEGMGLAAAANEYFAQSEQIPTLVALAAGPIMTPGHADTWRAGGLMVQHLPDVGMAVRAEEPGGEDGDGEHDRDDDWRRAEALAATIADHELLDPVLSPYTLLYRLFHEDGVMAAEPRAIARECRCSRAAVEDMLTRFPKADIAGMIEDGKVSVTCEFCNERYLFEPSELGLEE